MQDGITKLFGGFMLKTIANYILLVCTTAFVFSAAAQTPAPAPAAQKKSAQQMIDEIAERWTGNYTNQRQVDSNIARGGAAMPELTRDPRKMMVVKLDAPQLGKTILYFEEYRLAAADKAQRQRVVSLVFDEKTQKVRAQQYFFKAGPTYDRKPLDPQLVAKKTMADFRHEAKCDLYFGWDAEWQRYRGGMLPRACEYPHEGSGMVYADFEMLLYPKELWYRDRSIKLADGMVRGEIDGFSWLLFDRNDSAPNQSVSRLLGVWKGTFRRYDAEGKLTATFPSEIIARLNNESGVAKYHQTNRYQLPDGKEQVIESFGTVRDGRIWFANERVDGWSMDVAADTSQRMNIINMTMKDGSYVHEVISISDDGKKRSRATQFLKDGKIIRRTLIDEEKVTDDWVAYEESQKQQKTPKP
jgi:CpeT/CpcT family (DUF1001)/Domain of unknown function (DUF3598)